MGTLVPRAYSLIIGCVSLVGGRVRAMVTACQVDIKALIAYSSVVHMALVILVCLLRIRVGIQGGLAIILAHGVISSGMFYTATSLYTRMRSRRIVIGGGLMYMLPRLTLA